MINKEFNTKNEIYTKKFIGIDLNNIDDIISISDDFIKERINNNIKNFNFSKRKARKKKLEIR